MENRNVAPPARVLRATRVQVARTTVPSSSRACYALRRCYKLRSYYRLAQVSWRERFSQGTPLRYSVASFPSPTPSFSLLAVRTVGQATKSWAWDWERGYHELETAAADRQIMVNDNRLHRRPHPQLSCAAPPGPPSLRPRPLSSYWHAVRQFVRRAPQCPAFS